MKIVLANGCFDPLHYGHVLHLRAARKLGERLVVSVTRDEFVNKGPDRPVFSVLQRMDMISELRCVNEVLAVRDSLQALMIVMPDIFVKGIEYKDKVRTEEMKFCQEQKIQVAFTDEPMWSSTKLLCWISK